MSKHIILTKLFDFGGSNSHLKTLIQYFGEKNIILILESEEQLILLGRINSTTKLKTKVVTNLHPYAHFQHKIGTNIKEFFKVLKSVLIIKWLSIRYGFAKITINAVEPERYLYLFWTPFSSIYYILHSTPNLAYTPFTTYTCNTKLGLKKKIITVSKANRNNIINQWHIEKIEAQFVSVVYNCVINTKNKSVNDKNQSQARLTVITMGHLIAYKNPLLWMKVAYEITKVLNHVRFVWIGDGPLWNECKNKEKEFERISFIGRTSDPISLLQEATVYYQPSLFETQGIAVLEAMSLGLPCVVSNVGGLPESIKNNYNGLLVEAEKQQEHVDALTEILNNKELRDRLGTHAMETFKQTFTFSSFKMNMDKVYK